MFPTRVLNNNLVFVPANLPQIQGIFPSLKTAQTPQGLLAAIPHTLDSTRLLRNLGYKADSPIRTQYNWPIRPDRTPGWWQIDTAEFLTLHKRAHVHNSPRTRKTLSTLWAADFLRRHGIVKKILVVAPLSSLERAWGDELYFNLPHLRFAVLHGSAQKRRELLALNRDVYIVNFDGVEILLPELKKRDDINLIVVDEIHEYANSRTKRWKALKSIIQPEMWAWGLTGTPTPQDPTMAHGQSLLITPENYKGSFTAFKNTVMMQVATFKWVPRRGHEKIVQQVLSPSIRFERSVVTDMEPCLIERHAELSKEQQHHYTQLVRQATTEIRGTTVTAVNAAVLSSKLVQSACGVLYGANGEFLKIDCGPRLKVVEELIETNEEKVIVFVPFTGALEMIAKELRKRWTVEVVDGGVSAHKRAQVFKEFQTLPNPHIIVAHPNTMSYSLELTAASLIIWYAPCLTGNKIYQQACARIDGGGQKAKIDIAHVYSTPLERRLFNVLQEKGRLQEAILELLKDNH